MGTAAVLRDTVISGEIEVLFSFDAMQLGLITADSEVPFIERRQRIH